MNIKPTHRRTAMSAALVLVLGAILPNGIMSALAAEPGPGTKWIHIDWQHQSSGPSWMTLNNTSIAIDDIQDADGVTTIRFLQPTLQAARSQSDSTGWTVRSVEYRVEFRCPAPGERVQFHVVGFVEYEGALGSGTAHELPQVIDRQRSSSSNFKDGTVAQANVPVIRSVHPSFCPEPARPAKSATEPKERKRK
jgi:hypothetical protein